MNTKDFDNNYLQEKDFEQELENLWHEFEYEDFNDEENDEGVWYGDY